jgi:P27 family predicted phage terminase small subunit
LLQDVKVLNNQDKLFKQCRASAMDLGLTISSRCRLVIPTTDNKEKELSIEDRLFGL